MFNIFLSILGILITILLVVGIHEFGHFIVAKSLGVKVLRFSIGFGKPFCSWHDRQGTEYALAPIPLGGYVKMLDESEGPVSNLDLPYAYNKQPYYKKAAIVIAGPFSNLVFAFLIYWFLYTIGFVTIKPVIGDVAPLSIAASAGLKPQQEILFVDGKDTPEWMNVIIHMISRSGEQSSMLIRSRDLHTNLIQDYKLNLTTWKMNELKPDPLDSLGIIPYEPIIPAIVGALQPDSPAEKSKLLIGDKITAINGHPIKDWVDFILLIQDHATETLQFSLLRQNKALTLPVTIGYKRNIFFQKRPFLGISPAFEWPSKMIRKNQYGPIAALAPAYAEARMYINLNFHILGKMLSGKISLKSLGGPITIFESAGTALNHGYIAFLSFLAFLSISIGIINILPIPTLDGGHLFFQTIETLIRKPIPERVLNLSYRLGFVLIILIMIQALANDISRLA